MLGAQVHAKSIQKRCANSSAKKSLLGVVSVRFWFDVESVSRINILFSDVLVFYSRATMFWVNVVVPEICETKKEDTWKQNGIEMGVEVVQ